MSFSRHAYRHAVPPSSHSLVDHVWISEDFLASTFRRFANGQRRYESRVPGPLEARRRLAKRRNTALASLAGSGPLDDIGCLFGRNGREHMKWVGGQSRNAPREAQGRRRSDKRNILNWVPEAYLMLFRVCYLRNWLVRLSFALLQ